MPGKRKLNLAQSSRQARFAKVARSKENSAQAEIRRIQQAHRQATNRGAESQEERQIRLHYQSCAAGKFKRN